MQQVLPLLVGGDPGQFLVPREQPARSRPTKGFAWDVMTAPDRVVLTQLPLNQRVTKQTQNRDAQLHRGVGETSTTLDRAHFGSLWIGTVSQILDVESDLLAG